MDSGIKGFYRLTAAERRLKLKKECGLTDEEIKVLADGGLSPAQAEGMIENVVARFEVPLGVAVNFTVNGRDVLVPMATEEPSVVAAASNAARMVRQGGGFKTGSSEPIMVGQIQVVGAAKDASKKIVAAKGGLIDYANTLDPTLVKCGGGCVDLDVREVEDMLVIHLHVNAADAMGANAVNTMCEALAPKVQELSGGEVVLKIISNYALERTAKAECTVPAEAVGGAAVVERILAAQKLAEADVYRAVTHNKGVMNGVTAVVLATGNDTRAVEAGCHAYAAKDRVYGPLTKWVRDAEGNLKGSIEMPAAVGLVGGATRTHPIAKVAVKILGVKSARELGEVLAAVGLAQNLAALRALASEGIQSGHMRLHARNIAVTAGAKGGDVDEVAAKMVESGKVSVDEAKRIMNRKK
jgi:hydroxymethylglutaryl-CoA reductase